jgi:hypothetical protein
MKCLVRMSEAFNCGFAKTSHRNRDFQLARWPHGNPVWGFLSHPVPGLHYCIVSTSTPSVDSKVAGVKPAVSITYCPNFLVTVHCGMDPFQCYAFMDQALTGIAIVRWRICPIGPWWWHCLGRRQSLKYYLHSSSDDIQLMTFPEAAWPLLGCWIPRDLSDDL